MVHVKKMLVAGLIIIMGLELVAGVLAEAVTEVDVVNAKIKSGGFDLTTSPIDSFGDITIKLDDEEYSTGFERDFVIKDLRGLDDNWQLTVSATPLQSLDHAHHVYSNVLSISPLDRIVRVGNTTYTVTPDKALTQESVLDDGDVLIAKSENGSGLGQFSLTFPDEAVHLMVTPEMKEGQYEFTLSWNLLSVPSS